MCGRFTSELPPATWSRSSSCCASPNWRRGSTSRRHPESLLFGKWAFFANLFNALGARTRLFEGFSFSRPSFPHRFAQPVDLVGNAVLIGHFLSGSLELRN
jgi:hypothetical protein